VTTPSIALAAQVQALTEAVRACCNDPADAVRLLSDLAGYSVTATTGVSAAFTTMQSATAALCRRAALSSLARACGDYTPTSSTDAQATLSAVLALFDAEIQLAADAGQGASYSALRALRSAVANDINTRCARLPQLRQVITAAPTPALALAYRLYGDATRCDELTLRSGAECALFLPTSFEALSQ
jgi:prophage DNA circulation protein